MDYFFDSYAIIKIIEGSQSYKKFCDSKIITSVLNIGEIYAIFLRNDGKSKADEFYRSSNFELLEITPDIIVEAACFRYMNKGKNISVTDAVGYILSLKHNIKFLTGDNQFKNFPNVEFIK